MNIEQYEKQKIQEMLDSYELIKSAFGEICDYLKTDDIRYISPSALCMDLGITFEESNQLILLILQLEKLPDTFNFDNVRRLAIKKVPQLESMRDHVFINFINSISLFYSSKKYTLNHNKT